LQHVNPFIVNFGFLVF